MRIAIVTKNMLNGGAERVIHNLICEWSDNCNVEVHLILINDRQPIFYSIPDSCHLQVIYSSRQNPYTEKLDRFGQLRRIIRKIQPDVVLSMPEEIGIYVLAVLIGTGIPVVVSERNNPWLMPNKKVTRMLRRLLYPRAKGLIFQTEQAASFFSDKLRKKGIVLPNPLNTNSLPARFEGDREKVIVGAGRLDIQKNFPLLMDAFVLFYQTHPDYTLVIYGEGPWRAELEAYANQKGLPDGTISLPGRNSRLLEDIRTKAMFVLSSDFEGMPNVVIEAMAMGVPVVSTDCPSGGSAELIEQGVSGLLVPVGDAQAMADAMCRVADDPELAATLGHNSPAIRERLDCRVVAAKWMEYLETCSRSET